jgi:hypothetical protein
MPEFISGFFIRVFSEENVWGRTFSPLKREKLKKDL